MVGVRVVVTIGKRSKDIVIVMHRDAQLLEVVFTLCPAGRFSCLLDCWQKQGNQDCDNGNHDQQLDQCESAPGEFQVWHEKGRLC